MYWEKWKTELYICVLFSYFQMEDKLKSMSSQDHDYKYDNDKLQKVS